MKYPEKYRDWANIVLILLLFLAIFHKFINHTVIYRDSFKLYAPYKFLIAQALKSGTLYLWNPWQFFGMPFVADIVTGWLYPLNIVYLILPFGPAHNLFIFIHYPLAAIFMDKFLRVCGLDRDTSIMAALAFPLCGYMTSQHANMIFLIGPAWAPLAFYFAIKSLTAANRPAAIGAGAVLAIQIFAGEPQSAAITGSIIGIIYLSAAFDPARRTRALMSLATTLFFSFVLSAIQIFPTYEMLKFSIRNSGLSIENSAQASFHPACLIELIWKTPFGDIWPRLSFWGFFTLDSAMKTPWSISNYVGFPICIMSVIGLIFSKRKWKDWITAGAMLFLLLAMGRRTPVFGIFYHFFPFFDKFRYPSKYIVWFTGFVIVGAALGAQQIKTWCSEKPRLVIKGALAISFIAAVFTISLLSIWPSILQYVGNMKPGSNAYNAAMTHIRLSAVQGAAITLIAAVIFISIAKGKLSFEKGLRILTAFFIIDWYYASVADMPAGPSDIFDFRPIAAEVMSPQRRPELGKYRIFRENMEFKDTNPSLKSFTRFERQSIWDRSTLSRNFDTMEGFEDMVGYNASQLYEGLDMLADISPANLDVYNIKYIISIYGRPPLDGVKNKVIFSSPLSNISILELENTFPRFYWAPNAVFAKTDSEAKRLIDSTDMRKKVIISTNEKIDESPAATGEFILPVKVDLYEPDNIEIETDFPKDGWLVLSDRYYPGWLAYIDGKPANIYKANVFVRSVRVNSGKHLIVFKYRPILFYVGGAISVFMWFVLMIYLCVYYLGFSPNSVDKKNFCDQVTK